MAYALAGCKGKATQAQCDQLLDRFAELVVREKSPKDAPPETIQAERVREREEARGDDGFRNCTSEVSSDDFACAMKATTSDAMLKCLE